MSNADGEANSRPVQQQASEQSPSDERKELTDKAEDLLTKENLFNGFVTLNP